MRIANRTTSAGDAELEVSDRELSTALKQALDLPLSALRVSMEALFHELDGRTAAVSLPSVLTNVSRLERSVQDLISYATTPRPLPLRCTVDEIARSASSELPRPLRERVLHARHGTNDALHVDGPMLSRCLRRLIENALEAGSSCVLVNRRREEDGASFTVIDTAPEELNPEWAIVPFHTKRANHIGLGLPLVHRDLLSMGGTLSLFATPRGSTCVEVRVPDGSPEQEGAAR